MCVCVRARVCVRACVRACARACAGGRVRVRAGVRGRARASAGVRACGCHLPSMVAKSFLIPLGKIPLHSSSYETRERWVLIHARFHLMTYAYCFSLRYWELMLQIIKTQSPWGWVACAYVVNANNIAAISRTVVMVCLC